jgi:hypothetical protein
VFADGAVTLSNEERDCGDTGVVIDEVDVDGEDGLFGGGIIAVIDEVDVDGEDGLFGGGIIAVIDEVDVDGEDGLFGGGDIAAGGEIKVDKAEGEDDILMDDETGREFP